MPPKKRTKIRHSDYELKCFSNVVTIFLQSYLSGFLVEGVSAENFIEFFSEFISHLAEDCVFAIEEEGKNCLENWEVVEP